MFTYVLIVAVAVGFGVALLRSRGTISGPDARELISEGGLLVDVRTPAEFADHHVDGAQNIPVGELEDRLQELPDRNRAIVVYCRSGMRSARAQRLLRKHGYVRVENLGGMDRWSS